MRYTTLNETSKQRPFTQEFLGYNHRLRIGDGEFYDMKNLSSDDYPVLSTRNRRGILTYSVSEDGRTRGLAAGDKLIICHGDKVYYGDEIVLEGLDHTTDKQIAIMGAYVCIFPDKVYFNAHKTSENGSMEEIYSLSGSDYSSLNFLPCTANGDVFNSVFQIEYEMTDTFPTDGEITAGGGYPAALFDSYGAFLIKESANADWAYAGDGYFKAELYGYGNEPGAICDFSEINAGERIAFDGIALSENDMITDGAEEFVDIIRGNYFEAVKVYTKEETDEITGDKRTTYNAVFKLSAYDYSYQMFMDILPVGISQDPLVTVTVKNDIPDMDFVISCQNRLWGCKYGEVNGEMINEIYASALGEFKQWRKYEGIANDSYAASVGSFGEWTGAITYKDSPIFFKENRIHRVYVSSSGAHQIIEKEYPGIQRGSAKSAQIVGDILYYKSAVGVYAYDGSVPVFVSEALGNKYYKNARAGALKDKYYISMQDDEGVWTLFVLDTSKGLWHREDNTEATAFARLGKVLYFATDGTRIAAIPSIVGFEAEKAEFEALENEDMPWYAISGVMGYEYPDKKYVSRMNIRLELEKNAWIKVYFQYDSSGGWDLKGSARGDGKKKTILLPILPRRCDHLQMKLEGAGGCKIFSIARVLEIGSDK